jgi:hypothetical protein
MLVFSFVKMDDLREQYAQLHMQMTARENMDMERALADIPFETLRRMVQDRCRTTDQLYTLLDSMNWLSVAPVILKRKLREDEELMLRSALDRFCKWNSGIKDLLLQFSQENIRNLLGRRAELKNRTGKMRPEDMRERMKIEEKLSELFSHPGSYADYAEEADQNLELLVRMTTAMPYDAFLKNGIDVFWQALLHSG